MILHIARTGINNSVQLSLLGTPYTTRLPALIHLAKKVAILLPLLVPEHQTRSYWYNNMGLIIYWLKKKVENITNLFVTIQCYLLY